MKLKTLKDIRLLFECLEGDTKYVDDKDVNKGDCVIEIKNKLKQEAIKWIKNLQYKDTQYPIVLENFPDSQKGEIAKDKWNDTMFRYGSEYGMLAFIMYFFNITEEDLK